VFFLKKSATIKFFLTFKPLLLGFGCNVSAVYATRTLDN